MGKKGGNQIRWGKKKVVLRNRFREPPTTSKKSQKKKETKHTPMGLGGKKKWRAKPIIWRGKI